MEYIKVYKEKRFKYSTKCFKQEVKAIKDIMSQLDWNQRVCQQNCTMHCQVLTNEELSALKWDRFLRYRLVFMECKCFIFHRI